MIAIDHHLPSSQSSEVAVRLTRPCSISALVWYVLMTLSATLVGALWCNGFYLVDDSIYAMLLFPFSLSCMAIILKRNLWLVTGEVTEAFAQFLFASIIASLSSIVVARSNFPLIDGLLVRLDTLLFHANWIELATGLQAYPSFMDSMNFAYASIEYQPILFFLLVAAQKRTDIAQRFSAAWMTTLIITMMIFPFTPALGGYLFFHVSRADTRVLVDVAWSFSETFIAARNGTLRGLDSNAVAGLITFPSFHAAAAILMMRYCWPFRVARWPAITINVAMIVSAPVIGGHYLTDVVAGILVASISILLVDRCHARFRNTKPVSTDTRCSQSERHSTPSQMTGSQTLWEV